MKVIEGVTQDVAKASDQKRKEMEILENIKYNRGMANTITELVGPPLPPTAPPAPDASPFTFSSSSSSSQEDNAFLSLDSQHSSKRSSKKGKVEITKELEDEIKKTTCRS